ncbi:hypothetical protein HIM_04755 [Hirsutella minnesotensis 3608]|uniref:Ribosome quality control complex subunit 2 n=1 Tax=Hirsutella minnesotensis 3608 TaxID=1043627 RepID=A0A0F7ZL31_9HYPO|nr:hypothetical protein HIM_04755 [Hirsutella minnesotensis 3608]
MKQRFSSLDVKVIAHELNQSLVSLRVANIYDLSSKILLFKFAKPNDKKQLVVDSGFRCHLTEFARTTAAAPSAFVARLRKFLRTRRLTSVAQIGTDRVLELQFSDGQYRLYLEFFASGNIILTDAERTILTIARNVPEGENQEPQRVGLQYSLENRQNYAGIPPLSKERVRHALQAAVEKAAADGAPQKKLKGKPGGTLRKSLAISITEIPPVVVDHVLICNSFDTSMKLEDILGDEARLEELVRLLLEARKMVEQITTSSVCTGYIFARQKDGVEIPADAAADTLPKKEDLLYDDFHPFVPAMIRNNPLMKILEFQGYNQTVDEFFSSLEGQKLETRLTQKEATAKRKLEAARLDQAKRLEGLQEAQSMNLRKAAAIEANLERVQEAMNAVNGLLVQGMDWVDIGKLIEREKKRHNPVAEVIELPLKLAENIVTLKLSEEDFDDEEEEDPFETDESESEEDQSAAKARSARQFDKALTVEINLGLSPWSNAREYYDQKRTAAAKEEKTQLQATKALKSAEQKITEDLKKGLKQEKALLQPIRKQSWFEKFLWFVSSDGYLVIGGKDATQNELLYRKHLRKGDVYCHADLNGAPSVIIKNNPKTPDAPIPPATLSQAGSLSVCASDAWDSKAGMGAWWVNADQVSKSASTGEFLATGSFTVRGNKNHLPPAQLLLGLGVMFRISEESKARHVKHRLQEGDSMDKPPPTEDHANHPRKPAIAKEIDAGDVDENNDSDGLSEPESEMEQGTPDRENPLQAFGGRTEDNDIAEMEAEVSKLDVRDQTAVEEASQRDASEDGPEGQEPPETVADSAEGSNKASETSKPQPPGPKTDKKAPVKRGQKGKAKKMASKYKDQDEEDRLAAEALIGAAAGKRRAEAEAKAKEDARAELEAAKERRRAQHQRQQRETAEHEEIRRAMMEQGAVDTLDGDEAEAATAGLDDLVGTPLPGDEILEAIPVCAPWAALGRFKFKAKMQPGATKKGKAIKEVLERWRADSAKKGAVDDSARDMEKMWPREVALLKALKPEEVINSVPASKVRVMMAGGGGGGGGGGKGGGKGQAKGGRGGRGSKR